MSLQIAIADAARNCARDGATATLTLRSGATFSGKFLACGSSTVHIQTTTGWATLLLDELAAVEVRR